MAAKKPRTRPRKTPKGGTTAVQQVAAPSPPPTTDGVLIRELFIKRKPYYAIPEVLRLVRIGQGELDAAIGAAAVTLTMIGGRTVLSWEDVATLALERWTPRMIDAALGHQRLGVVPVLNRVQHIDAFLPLYQIRLLHHMAERDRGGVRARLNVSDILERQLLDLASAEDADALDEVIPGFRAAVRYPYFIERDDDFTTAFCRFCGRLSGVAGREMCDDCIERHEPKPHLGEHGIPELDREE